uniref:Uncharacterized protein n=2 Tax=Amphimedon queenslandica TaxID=400682 RepID=A0A1X7U1U4_AMPQE
MLGAPGAGKTCAQLLLLDEDPPTEEVTDSTSIACPTVRAIRVAVNDENKKWKRVNRDELLERLATDLNEASEEKQKEIGNRFNSGTETTLASTGHTSASPSLVSNEKPAHESQHPSLEPIEEEVEFHAQEVIQKILTKKPKGVNLKDQNWLYVIDSGGQPAYQELLPLFTRAASLNIITLDLSKPLDKKFDMMYRIDGRHFPCCSKSTQLASFQSTVSTAANFKSLDIPSVTKQHGNSMHLVLGTHYDKVNETTLNKCEDTLKTSMSSLQPYLRDRIICNNKKSEGSVIFPVNTIAKSEERVKLSKEICEAVWVHGSDASLTIKIPIRWFAFELSLPEERRIISFKEALSIGERYGMKEEDTRQALQYFHDVSLMLYYPEVTDVVFVDPKPILNILSELLALTYVNDNSAQNSILLHNHRLSKTIINHLKDGFFYKEIFKHLKSNIEIFSQPEFQLCDLISLLLHLNIITKVEDNIKGEYFIPYTLSSYQGSAIPTVSDVRPLLVVWRRDHDNCEILPVPQGLFPLAVMHLLNQKDLKTELPSSRPDYYFKFRDAMSIKITFNQIPHTLHLINRYTHIEVSFIGPQEHCPIIRNLIMKTIGKVTDDLHLKHNYVNAFNCLQDQEKKCVCIVKENAKEELIVNCTDCPKSCTIEGNDYWCWFKGSTDEIDSQITCSTGPIAESVKMSVRPPIFRKRRHSEDFELTEVYPIKKQIKTDRMFISSVDSNSCINNEIPSSMRKRRRSEDSDSTEIQLPIQKQKTDNTDDAQILKTEKDSFMSELTSEVEEQSKNEKQIITDLKEKELYIAKLVKEKSQLQERVTSLEEQSIKETSSIGLQFNYLIPSMDSLDSSVIIAGQKLFILQGDRSDSLQWEKYGFRLECPQGAVSKDTEVAVTALAGGNFKVPKGIVLVSAVYAISVSKGLLKPLVIELQHCVDLRKTSQTGCLKFVRAPLKSPNAYQFSIVEGGSFSVGNRYGSIERDEFCALGIVHVGNGDTPNGGGNGSENDTQTQGTNNDSEEETNGDTPNDSSNGAGENSSGGGATPSTSTTPPHDSINDDPSQLVHEVGSHTTDKPTVQQSDHALSDSDGPTATVSSEQCPARNDDESLQSSTDHFTAHSDNNTLSCDTLYSGMMYYDKKEVGHWKAMYTVVRDLEVLKRHLESKQASSIEYDDVVDSFKFIQPNGTLELTLHTGQQVGWTVDPIRNPMKLFQSRVDQFPLTPSYATCSISVYAEIGLAKKPLHCPIDLTGIDPSMTIYINRCPPPSPSSMIDSTSSSSSATSVSQTRRETEEGTFRSDIAHRVMTECTGMIKERVGLYPLIDRLVEKRMISDAEKGQIIDTSTGLTANERMDELLSLVKASIIEDGEDFGLFLEIIKQENTRRADRLAQTLLDNYKRLV